MRVFYDGEIFTTPGYGGVNLVFEELAAGLADEPAVDVYRFRFPDELASNLVFGDALYALPKLGGLLRRVDERLLARRVRRVDPDVYHPSVYRVPESADATVVITIHDMIPELFPEVQGSDRMVTEKRRALSRADHVVAVSENTKSDLVEVAGVDPERVSVVYPAPNPRFRNPPPTDRTVLDGLPDRFLLYVGRRDVYKNFTTLLEAYAEWGARDDVALVCAGGSASLSDEEEQVVAGADIESRVFLLGDVTTDQLHVLYDAALAFAYPSKYEGFGIPPLEAMACGTPVVASDRASVPEVVGDAAVLVDPDDPDAVREGLTASLDEDRRADLVARGSERVDRFTWDRTCDGVLDVYEQATRESVTARR